MSEECWRRSGTADKKFAAASTISKNFSRSPERPEKLQRDLRLQTPRAALTTEEPIQFLEKACMTPAGNNMKQALDALNIFVLSKGAKLCTYHHWFGRPSKLRFEPCYELPMASVKSVLWCNSDLGPVMGLPYSPR